MIIKNFCLLLEVLSFIICIHYLYGEKLKLDIATISLLALDMIMMQIIDFYSLPSVISVFIYPVIAVYCSIKFGRKTKPILINMMLSVILIGGTQWIVALLISYFFDLRYFRDVELLLIGFITFAVIFCILSYTKIKSISYFLQDSEEILNYSVAICLFICLVWVVAYKKMKLIEISNTFILFVCVAIVLILSVKLIKYKIKAKEVETELRMYKLFSNSFQGLIDDIRLRQHEFKNHINAIYSQHFSYDTYEDLVNAQKNYCEILMQENRFNKLLLQGNPVIRSFLYGRFIEISRMGIEISYQVLIRELDIGIPIYKIVEILGDLLDNAVEALMENEETNKLHVDILENNNFYLEVRNESLYVTYEMLESFFSKGYSKKGENRGLGLYNVKKICEKYKMEIAPLCIEIDGKNWLSFKIWKKL